MSSVLTNYNTPIVGESNSLELTMSDAPGTGMGSTDASSTSVAPLSSPKEWVLDPGVFTQLPDRAIQELWFELRTWSWK